uniref:Tetraspanin-4-like isoform X2 n=1 Tax=Geotrypetes seraphini TaxID=260995 RepID=A0A6P8SJT3_GEOSA|nr:tetraspanin-4-like isoform X2 [Geotrypetes seraphini]
MSMSRGCLLCIKIKMFIFNLIFWLGGCGILGVGIWLAVTQGKFATLSYSFPSLSAASLFMVIGSMIMVIGFIGCLGAVTENRCLLLTFFLLLLLIFLLEIIGMLMVIIYREEIDSYAQEDLKKGLKLFGKEENTELTNAWNIVQTMPCYKKVKYWLGENISALGAFAICIVVIQVLGLVFSMFMYCQVLRAEKYYE